MWDNGGAAMLDDLLGVIETLKGRIATHGPTLRENETRTRMALIDPLLRALGWDVSDPAMVTPEYSVGASRADYALLTLSGIPSALVEAKKLDESLASHRMQMLNYANASGIPYAGLTDGNHWEMYTVFDQAPIEQRRILDVSIDKAPAHESALKFLLLWQPNLTSGQPVPANEPVLANQERSENSQTAKLSTDVPSESTPVVEVAEPAKAAQGSSIWKPLSDIIYQMGDSKPIGIRFSGEIAKPVKNWVDTWFEVCEWLAANGKLTASDCPVPSPSGQGVRVLINTNSQHPPSSKHPGGNNFAQPRTTSTGLFIETNYNPQNSIRNSRFLLEKLGVPLETVELRFE